MFDKSLFNINLKQSSLKMIIQTKLSCCFFNISNKKTKLTVFIEGNHQSYC